MPVIGPADAELTRALQSFAKQRLLPCKYPRLTDGVTELPKTGSGKIDRQAVKRGG